MNGAICNVQPAGSIMQVAFFGVDVNEKRLAYQFLILAYAHTYRVLF